MFHALAYILFILIFTAWLGYELGRKYSLRTYWKWIAGAVLVGLAGSVVSEALSNNVTGNFLLHASGGVSSTLLFIYFTKTLRISFGSWRLALAALFAFVCTLGVLNELTEYFIEMTTGLIFSVDSHDTWRDFAANTTGAAIAWLCYMLAQVIWPKR